MGILVRELTALYAGAPPLPVLPVQYGDFAAWQHEALTGEVLARELDYWRTRAGSPPRLELPADRPRREVRGHAGANLPIEIAPEVTTGLARLSREHQVTLFMTLLAGYQALLELYSGEEDVVVGCPIAGRDRLETEGAHRVLPQHPRAPHPVVWRPDFPGAVGRVRETVLEAYTHRDFPFDFLVESPRPERTAGNTVLFNVLFLFQNVPEVDLDLPGLTLRQIPFERGVSAFDLTLELRQSEDRLTGVFNYSTELFDADTIEVMARSFERLLEQIVARPEARLSELDLAFDSGTAPLFRDSLLSLEAC